MLASEMWSMLATSMAMATFTGGPAGGGGTREKWQQTNARTHVHRHTHFGYITFPNTHSLSPATCLGIHQTLPSSLPAIHLFPSHPPSSHASNTPTARGD